MKQNDFDITQLEKKQVERKEKEKKTHTVNFLFIYL